MAQANILGLASDLFFAPKIDAAAIALGYSTNWVTEYRSVAEFLQVLQTDPPALVILDVNSSLPWIEWLPAAKVNAATSSIPWLVFGSHMNPRRLAAARRAGADKVVPKSQFNAELTELIQALI
jgi:DNA-binding NarL/FixJ family response regulator